MCYNHITRNLESGSPKSTHQIYQLQTVRRKRGGPIPDDIVLHGRFLFQVTAEPSVLCLDMDSGLQLLWERRNLAEPSRLVLVKSVDIQPTEKPGRSVMKVLVQVEELALLFFMDLIDEPKGSVRLVETKTTEVPLKTPIPSPLIRSIVWQGDWILVHFRSPFELYLINIYTSGVYRSDLERVNSSNLPPDSGMSPSRQRNSLRSCTFAGGSHIVAIYSDWRGPRANLSLFPLPTPSADPVSEILERESNIVTHEITSRWGSDGRQHTPPHHHQMIDNPLVSFLTGVYDDWDNDGSHLAAFQFSINQPEFQPPLQMINYPYTVAMEFFSRYSSWIVAASKDFTTDSEVGFYFTRVNHPSKEIFGTPKLARIPLRDTPSPVLYFPYPFSFDEYTGRCYLLPHHLGQSVYVIDLACGNNALVSETAPLPPPRAETEGILGLLSNKLNVYFSGLL